MLAMTLLRSHEQEQRNLHKLKHRITIRLSGNKSHIRDLFASRDGAEVPMNSRGNGRIIETCDITAHKPDAMQNRSSRPPRPIPNGNSHRRHFERNQSCNTVFRTPVFAQVNQRESDLGFLRAHRTVLPEKALLRSLLI
jgi:hypothetical protein